MPAEQRILAIIQARAGSTRLPGKVLNKLEGKTVLEHVVRRVQASKLIGETVVATTVNQLDKTIVELCAGLGIRSYCGSENDVLDRFYQAVLLFGADHIVRITSDCPLMDPAVIDLVISRHLQAKADYTANVLRETYPDGEDVEVFSLETLKKAWLNARLTSEREHVTPYIRNHPELFKLAGVENEVDLSAKRWTLDNPEDLAFVREIYRQLYKQDPLFGMAAVLDLLRAQPAIEQLNHHINRNEGMAKSLREDKVIGNG
ncbi:MAG: glycosyltransferase family protein [Candidatus Margulisiibacteriota bacterium]